ncbi:zinc finger protein SNAI3 [Engraulis encrasicolus]|uniref:zinc finger protein SNAI3 n=1 Tax=Engraulis encrasicolus TaxID=184585 RepID=UPI002FD5EB1E
MPRSFLVKKHLPCRKPNYGRLDSMEHEVHASQPEFPYSVSSRQQQAILCWEAEPCLTAYAPSALTTQMDLFHAQVSKTMHHQQPSQAPRVQEEQHTFSSPAPLHHPLRDLHTSPDPPRSNTHIPQHLHQVPREVVVPSGAATFLGMPGAGGQERFECFDCHKAYFTFSGLAKHRQLHCEWQCHKFFSCKYCEKEYVSLGALKMHIRTHTLPCVCKLCGKAFSRPWLLQGHIRTHTGEKPFSCPHCSRAFADRSNLRAHLQTHSDIKKYQCRNCSKTFSRISLLSKHEEAGCCPMA